MKEYMLYLEKMKMILGIDRERKIVNIKGLAKFTKARYKSSKSVLEHIIDLTKVKDDFEDNKYFGTALNEGITEWVRLKTVSGNESYEMEVNVVENIIGAKKIIEIVNTKPEEMHKALNMSKSEFRSLCNKMDYLEFINSLKEKIEDNLLELNDGNKKLEKFNKKEGKYINKEIKSTAIYIQNQLITKLIIPYFENNSDGSGIFEKVLNCKNLIKDYFRWIYIDREVFSEFTKTSEYKKLSNMLDKIIIQCIKKNQTNIEKWEKKKTFDFYRILLDKFNEVNDSNYRAFVQKIWKRIEKIQLEEAANILEKVKAEIERQDKIDVRLFSKDYKNEYTSVDINKKVSELILRRKLTDVQYRDLQSEIGIYNSCKQVISRKDIKRLKNKDGSTRYYVLINGEEYADPYLKKLKFGKKFLSSRRYEIKEEAIANLKENKFKYNLIVDFNKVTCPIVEKSSKKVVEDVER